MKNYKLTLSYDGSRYYGWEHQPNRETVQGKLETVLSKMCDNKPVDVIGAGRTDAGVHAKEMVASVRLETDKTPDEIRAYMNRYLPDDISVDDLKEAAERFHARYKAVGKTYCYTCYVGDSKPVFNRKYVTVLDFQPDAEAMKKAAAYLTGEHDYKSFCSNPQMKKSTVRIVDTIEIARRKDYLYLDFHGTGFLQNMVRILVGTLLEVGAGRMAPEDVKRILEAKDRTQAGPTAPAGGLCLMKVDY
jgi:tRNA pseudouridine38-40 synthase